MKPDTTSASETERSPIEKALDVGVYAPLGFALEFRRLVPELAEAGRQQVAFSRSLGKAALSTLGKAAAAQTRAAAPKATESKPAAPKAAKPTAAKPKPAAAKPKTSKPKTSKAAKPAKKSSGATKQRSVVEGYDGLTAREVIALSTAATAPQRAWMLDREQAGKQRKTVLKALDAS